MNTKTLSDRDVLTRIILQAYARGRAILTQPEKIAARPLTQSNGKPERPRT